MPNTIARISDVTTVVSASGTAYLSVKRTGAFATEPSDTGAPEIDTLARALAASDRRLAEILSREREFSANASHQLRTPLAALRISLDRGDLATASAEVNRLSDTVDHLLSLARGALPTTESANVGELARDAGRRWAPVFEQANRAIAVTVADDLHAGRIRATSVEQAVDVILDNSITYGSGVTRIAVAATAGGVVVSISDDGPGIPPGHEERVFHRHEGEGTGIGLALARTLVEADGGRLLLPDPARAEFRIILLAERNPPS